MIDFKGPKLDAIPENSPPQAIANCSANAVILNNQVIRNAPNWERGAWS